VKRSIFFIAVFLIAGTLRAQQIDDHAFAQQYRLARVYEETKDYANAMRIYIMLHKARPDASEVSDGLFKCYYTLKRYSEADTLLTEETSKKQPSLELYVDLARVRAKLNRKQESLEAFDHALKAPSQYDNFSSVMYILQTMTELGYQEEALAMLIRERKNAGESDLYTREIAGLYFKLGKYEEGANEYLGMLRRDEHTLPFIEQRVAQFTADTTLRSSIIKVVTSHIDINEATPGELRLLGWCYGELKNYRGALTIYLKLDNLGIQSSSKSAGGYELYEFANRIRKEGAFEIAATAYSEAIKRFHEGAGNDPQRKYFVAMAELGSLETREAYLRSLPSPSHDSLDLIVAAYQTYAPSQPNDLAFEALLHAGELAFGILHRYPDAKNIYENIVKRSQSFNDKTRDSYFALEEIALAQGDIAAAVSRLAKISDIISKRNRVEDSETVKHILFERARIDYFNGAFDSSLVKLDSIITDPNSDYTNDAIGLHSLITENSGNLAALKLFAKAELTALGTDLNSALSAYRSIPENYPGATIADESILRAVEILVQLQKPNDALAMLATMQEKMLTSPLLDKAAFREAEIIETIIKDKAKALRLYEDFLERYPKSPLCTESRRRARTLRGDSF
jgi:tetratricopeptide (TPR) repeat protein